MPRRKRRPFRLTASIGELTGWQPRPDFGSGPRTVQTPAPPFLPSTRSRTVLNALEAIPKLTADVGLAMAARHDATVEVLPGAPTTVVFAAGGQVQGLLVTPTSETTTRRLLGLPEAPDSQRDLELEAFWEEDRRACATNSGQWWD